MERQEVVFRYFLLFFFTPPPLPFRHRWKLTGIPETSRKRPFSFFFSPAFDVDILREAGWEKKPAESEYLHAKTQKPRTSELSRRHLGLSGFSTFSREAKAGCAGALFGRAHVRTR